MPNAFQPMTREHFLALGCGALVAFLFIHLGRRGDRDRKVTATLLAVLNFSIYPLSVFAWWSLDGAKSIDNFLPFHLCDIAAITAGVALLTRQRLFCTLTYFWGLAATIQGVITPAITVGFPALPFITFFIHHFAVVTAALYLPLVDGWRPRMPVWKCVLEVYAWSLAYLAFAMTANHFLGSNFAFASHPPSNPSLIDQLGPWPWYLLAMQAVGLVLFSLLALPFARKR